MNNPKSPRGRLSPALKESLENGLKEVREKLDSMTKEEKEAFYAECYEKYPEVRVLHHLR